MRSLEIGLLATLLVGCGMKHLREQAATDFRCAAGNVRVKELGGRAYRVEGCSKAATYVCEELDENCMREVEATEYAPKTSSTTGTKVEGERYVYELPSGFTRDGDAFVDTVGKHAVRVRVVATNKDEELFAKEQFPDADIYTRKVDGHPFTFARIASFSEIRTLVIVVRDGKAYELTCAGPPTKPPATDAVCESVLLSFRVI